MFPLKALIFPQRTPEQTTQSSATRVAGRVAPGADEAAQQQNTVSEERRRQPDRRKSDRREKQQSILLDTRKAQGRRRSHGRRATDLPAAENSSLPISIKG